MRILIVEDDEKIASFIVKGLKQAGYTVDHAPDGELGLEMALSNEFDAAVMDIMLPGMDGLAVIEAMRRNKVHTPVLILSAKREVSDRVHGLEAGGDDYLVKPFSFAELQARLQALIRRSKPPTDEPTKLKFAGVVIDLLTREVRRDETSVELQPREYQLLEYFMRNPGRVISKTMILEHVWGYNFDPQTNVVDVLVCRLRNKIDRDYDAKLLHTLRGVGYVLKPEN